MAERGRHKAAIRHCRPRGELDVNNLLCMLMNLQTLHQTSTFLQCAENLSAPLVLPLPSLSRV